MNQLSFFFFWNLEFRFGSKKKGFGGDFYGVFDQFLETDNGDEGERRRTSFVPGNAETREGEREKQQSSLRSQI